jgi:hypothetical protein
MTTEDLYFEIADGDSIVRIEPIVLLHKDSDNDWDKNCIKTNITVKGGSFTGKYNADFMTLDFEKFKQEFEKLYDNLSGYANFYGLESYLELKIKGDGIGHFEVDVTACDEPGINESKLNFTLSFDQTQIQELVRQLDNITKEFPVTGDIKAHKQ